MKQLTVTITDPDPEDGKITVVVSSQGGPWNLDYREASTLLEPVNDLLTMKPDTAYNVENQARALQGGDGLWTFPRPAAGTTQGRGA